MKNKIFRRAGAERQEKEMRGVFRAFLWLGAGWKKEGPLSGEGEECHQAVPGAKKGAHGGGK